MNFKEGFVAVCKSIYKCISDYSQKTQAEYQEYRERYKHYDVDRLMRVYESSSGVKKMALASLIREKNGSMEEY